LAQDCSYAKIRRIRIALMTRAWSHEAGTADSRIRL
jgi:hypothetical protein